MRCGHLEGGRSGMKMFHLGTKGETKVVHNSRITGLSLTLPCCMGRLGCFTSWGFASTGLILSLQRSRTSRVIQSIHLTA